MAQTATRPTRAELRHCAAGLPPGFTAQSVKKYPATADGYPNMFVVDARADDGRTEAQHGRLLALVGDGIAAKGDDWNELRNFFEAHGIATVSTFQGMAPTRPHAWSSDADAWEVRDGMRQDTYVHLMAEFYAQGGHVVDHGYTVKVDAKTGFEYPAEKEGTPTLYTGCCPATRTSA